MAKNLVAITNNRYVNPDRVISVEPDGPNAVLVMEDGGRLHVGWSPSMLAERINEALGGLPE